MSVCHLKRAESKSFCFQREVVFCLLFLGVNSTLRANLFPGLEGPLTFLFFFFFSSLPPAKYKEYIWVHFCVHSYIFVCVCWLGDIMGMEEFNHLPTDVCVWYWFVAVWWALLQALWEGHKPPLSKRPPLEVLRHTNTVHPIFQSMFVGVRMCV